MSVYLYPIIIKREAQEVRYDESKLFEEDFLTLDLLQPFVGSDKFTVVNDEFGRHEVTAHRCRMETDSELQGRIAKDEAYMAEYHRRQKARHG